MIKRTTLQDDVTLVNIYVTNLRASNFIKQLLEDIRDYVDLDTLIVGDLNTPLSHVDGRVI